jgi:membrane-bound ClpP family serine protease
VRTNLNPKGTVLAEGELWTAIAEGSTIEAGEEVIITKTEGLKLWVTKKSKEKEVI